MLAAMNALRISAAATAALAIFTAAAALGSCSNGPEITLSDCAVPVLGELSADGGPDPCHCDPPESLHITTCGCLSGNPQEVANYHACMALYQLEQDAGAEGGPIPGGCAGQCWPIPPLDWMSPLLLWIGAENDAPPCPLVTPAVIYDGHANGTFAFACTSNASGTCPAPGDICAPAYAEGFSQCVVRNGDLNCPLLGPYTERHVFYEDASGQPSTFCCLPSPPPQQ
jgi:hypothetical protein